MNRLILLAVLPMHVLGASPPARFIATLTELDSSGVNGKVLVDVADAMGDDQGPGLRVIGMARGLEANLVAAPDGSDCTDTNGCGAHVHSGTACTDATSQGGHYFEGDEDPWATVGYQKTSKRGSTKFRFSIKTAARDILGKPFILHNNAGGRVACGLLVSTEHIGKTFTATLNTLESSGPAGKVKVRVTPTGLTIVGKASGLEANLLASPKGSDCTATNGCGAHVHSGTACTAASTQGGHYFAGSEDPWASVGYRKTNGKGSTRFRFSVKTTALEIMGKPFIVHNNAGGRVACGLLTLKQAKTHQDEEDDDEDDGAEDDVEDEDEEEGDDEDGDEEDESDEDDSEQDGDDEDDEDVSEEDDDDERRRLGGVVLV